MEDFLVPTRGAQAEYVEKKSRFIATIRPVSSEEEAYAFIDEMRKKYYDARHNCYAFVIGADAETVRSSDDGEPGGTAGRPMLEVLLGSGIRNIAVVVTRYFGGTLLGTGGLVRAYSGVARMALEKCETARQCFGVSFLIKTDYNSVGRVLHLLESSGLQPYESAYGADVELSVFAPLDEYGALCAKITEVTSAKAVISEMERGYRLRLGNP